jgi:hypothetical protein
MALTKGHNVTSNAQSGTRVVAISNTSGVAGSNRMVLAVAWSQVSGLNPTCSGCTYGGVAMTELVSWTSANFKVKVFYMLDADMPAGQGFAICQSNYPANYDDAGLQVLVFTDAKQAAPVTYNNNVAATPNITNNLTMGADPGFHVGFAAHVDGTDSWTASDTYYQEYTNGGLNDYLMQADEDPTLSGADVLTWTPTTAADSWMSIGIHLIEELVPPAFKPQIIML